MAGPHWGEIPEPPMDDLFIPDVSADIEKSMDQHCLDEYQEQEEYMQIDNIKLPSMDPLVMYAIALHKYANNMTDMIRVAELAKESNLIPPEDAKPPLPEIPKIDFKHKPNSLNFIPPQIKKDEEDHIIPELSDIVTKQILTKCIVTMLAHSGFETTFQSVLDVLTNVVEEFFHKICGRFVEAVDEEELLKTGGFPNVLERVLVEMGFGGAKGLNDYYQGRVLKYMSVLQKRCTELDAHYSSVLVPKSSSPIGEIGKLFKVKVKEEEEHMESDNPELHFTAMDSDILTTGYQLLNHLESASSSQGLTDSGEAF